MIQSRRISAACSVVDEGLSDVECLAELDSHADTCAFGSNCYVLKDWDVMMTVDPFLPSLGSAQNVKVVSVVVVYDCPINLRPYLLVFHQSLYMPEMTRHLLCPMEKRMNSVEVNEICCVRWRSG